MDLLEGRTKLCRLNLSFAVRNNTNTVNKNNAAQLKPGKQIEKSATHTHKHAHAHT